MTVSLPVNFHYTVILEISQSAELMKTKYKICDFVRCIYVTKHSSFLYRDYLITCMVLNLTH